MSNLADLWQWALDSPNDEASPVDEAGRQAIAAASWCVLDADGRIERTYAAEHDVTAIEVELATGRTGWRPALGLASDEPDARARRIGAALAGLIGEPDAEHVMRLVADHDGEVWAAEIVLRRLRRFGVQAAIDGLVDRGHATELADLLWSAFGHELSIDVRTYAYTRWSRVAVNGGSIDDRRKQAAELLAVFVADRCAP